MARFLCKFERSECPSHRFRRGRSIGAIRRARSAFRMTATSISLLKSAPCTGVR